jgi:hypothetical protein
MSSQYFHGAFEHKTSNASISDLTPPTFSGITAVIPNMNGTIQIEWNPGTTTKPRIRYSCYVGIGILTAAELFTYDNWLFTSPDDDTHMKLVTLGDDLTYFTKDLQYTFGVRAVDAYNISDTNTVVITATALGTVNIANIFQTSIQQLVTTESALNVDLANLDRIVSTIAGAGGLAMITEISESNIELQSNELIMTIDINQEIADV